VNACLIADGFLCTADPSETVVPRGSVLIVDGVLTAVGASAEVADAVARLPEDMRATMEVIDARSMMVLPGFVNAHWHDMYAMTVPMRLLPPPSDRNDPPHMLACGGDMSAVSTMFDSFDDMIDKMLPDEAYAIAQYSMLGQLRGGVTTLADTGSLGRPESMVAAARDLGIRFSATTWASDAICPADQSTFVRTRDVDVVLAGIEELLELCGKDTTGLIRCRPSIAYVTNMTDELAAGYAELAGRYGSGLATHVGAVANEPDMMTSYYGTTGLRRLDAFGLVTDKTLAAHCSFVDAHEQELLLSRKVHVSQSPAKYGGSGETSVSGSGIIPRLRRRGLEVSLSTDGAAGPQAGMPEAMRAAWQMYNEVVGDNTALLPTDALAMATRIAAKGTQWDDEVGSLVAGKKADIVLVRTDSWRYELNSRPLEAFLWLGGSHDVDTVIVDGRVIIRGGDVVGADAGELRSRYLDALRSFSTRCLGIPSEAIDHALGTTTH